MLKWLLRIGGALVLIVGILFWWLILSGSDASKATPGAFDIDDWRSKAAAPSELLPTDIRILEVGRDLAPPFAAQAGRFGTPVAMSYNAIEIVYPDRSIIVGGAVDRVTAEGMNLVPFEFSMLPSGGEADCPPARVYDGGDLETLFN